VTLANPFGPVARGRAAVEKRLDAAAANYTDDRLTGFDHVSKYETPELAYLVAVERYHGAAGGIRAPDIASLLCGSRVAHLQSL
jgi:hypothetical protein